MSLHHSFILMSLGLSVWFGIQGLLPRSAANLSENLSEKRVQAKTLETENIETEAIAQGRAELPEMPSSGPVSRGGVRGGVRSGDGWMAHLRSLRSMSSPAMSPGVTWMPVMLGQGLWVERPVAGGEVPVAVRQNEQQTGRVLVDLSDRKLYLYVNGDLDTQYDVAIGREEWETPVGHYRVGEMQRDPAWEHPLTGRVVPAGPENPLGAAWISFLTDGDYSFGLHGTLNESLMGEAVSHGCVRMRNDDILALYERVQPGWSLDVVR